MSIERISRYYHGPIFEVKDSITEKTKVFVYRKFPTGTVNYIKYTWEVSDQMSSVAHKFNLGTKFWWEIADINPEILDVFNISPGTEIRIPYGQ
jgi:hypothetical protein